MNAVQETYRRIEDSPREIARWLERFLDSRGAMMEPEGDVSDACNIVVHRVDHGEMLLVDVGAVPFARAAFDAGAPVIVSRFCGDDHISTEPLRLIDFQREEGREFAQLAYPRRLTIERRRREFRAVVRRGLQCRVTMSVGNLQRPLVGELMNLSQGGCQVRFSLDAIHLSDAELESCSLTLSFPNGEEIALQCRTRHFDPSVRSAEIVCGFEFVATNSVRDRMLWHYVCEIEREAARGIEGGRTLPPSELFLEKREKQSGEGLTTAPDPAIQATPMALELHLLGNKLGALLRDFRQRGVFESSALSRYADRVLDLHAQDAQELLFALVCLPQQPRLVRHCLAVAVRLTEISRQLQMPRERVKAVAACALVHDFHLALDDELRVDPKGIATVDSDALARVTGALHACGWLPGPVITEAVAQIHERLDGSGVPKGLRGDDIGHLARLAAVVDVLDLRCRRAPDITFDSYSHAREELLTQSQSFAKRWVNYFFSVFGDVPVGAEVATSTGQRFCVRRLHRDGSVAVLVPLAGESTPTAQALAREMTGAVITGLGTLREVGGTG